MSSIQILAINCLFLAYFLKTWFSNGLDGTTVSLFRRWEWNQFDNDGSRTNNHNEAYNGKLEKIINKPHRRIWEFVEKIKSEETFYKLGFLVRICSLKRGLLLEIEQLRILIKTWSWQILKSVPQT